MSNFVLFPLSVADDMTQVGMPIGEMGSARIAAPDSDDVEHITRGAAIVWYLVQHSPEFVELRELRKLVRQHR